MGDPSVGTAAVNVNYTIDSIVSTLNIAVVITGNYNGNTSPSTDGLITVAVPTPGGLITGGGKLSNSNTAGYVKGSTASVTDFSFYVQYNKSLTNPQGGVEIIVRSYNDRNGIVTPNIHTYKLKSNAISVLSLEIPKAQFTGKANVSEIVNGVEQSIEGNCIMQLNLYDANAAGATPGSVDQLAATIYRKSGGIWYSSNWDGTKTILSNLFEGLLSVSGSGGTTTSASLKTVSTNTAPQDLALEVITDKLTATAYPNPAFTHFSLKLSSNNTRDSITVKVIDAMGKVVELRSNVASGQTIQIGSLYRPGIYFVQMIQGNHTKQLKLIKTSY